MNNTVVSILALTLLWTLSYGQTNNTLTDIDGNVYKVIKIGQELWMAENLRTTRYNDGSPINHVIDNSQWRGLNSGAWCSYGNKETNDKTYGKLYNWYATSRGNLCPTGWHLPNENEGESEWNSLIRTLGGNAEAGGKMKERGYDHWLNPNVNASNQSGFNGLPGGSRGADGTFDGIGFEGLWWSTFEQNILEFSWSRSRILFFDSQRLDYFDGDKRMGLSVRCVKS
jgi:uncharacterized protein (TIGR02145 family)